MDIRTKRLEAIKQAQKSVEESKDRYSRVRFCKYRFTENKKQMLETWERFLDGENTELLDICKKSFSHNSDEKYESRLDKLTRDRFGNMRSLLGLNLSAAVVGMMRGLKPVANTSSTKLRKRRLRTKHIATDPDGGIFASHPSVEKLNSEKSKKKFYRYLSNKTVNAARRDVYKPDADTRDWKKMNEEKIQKLKKQKDQ